ncbi:MAG: dTDP-4-dehydrorhamnose reductase [Bacteroidota bacterium]
MKIIVTGGNGQLGTELKIISAKAPRHEFLFTDIEDMDITNPDSIEKSFRNFSPDYIINCAGYTAVDKAEEEPDKAFLINRDAVKKLSEASKKYNARLIHISTDYIFDGKTNQPYSEDQQPHPLSVYGQSKWEGEQEVDITANGAVVRTSWLYSSFGQNFVKTIIRLAEQRDELKIVADQTGTPTYAGDLAEMLIHLLQHFRPGIFHYSNEGVATWYDFAHEIISLADLQCKIVPISTKEYPLPAPRPHYSVMDKKKVKDYFGLPIPYWRDSLQLCMSLLKKTQDQDK